MNHVRTAENAPNLGAHAIEAATPVAALDDAIADLFALDLQIAVTAEQPLGRCSAECTNDGCTRPSKC